MRVKQRNSNIEMLRLLAMLMVVVGHGSMNVGAVPQGFNRFVLNTTLLGDMGVDIFVLISGYCMCKAEFRWRKVVDLCIQTITWSLLGTVFAVFVLNKQLGMAEIVVAFTPVTNKTYWFVTAYVVLFIFTPYINKLVEWLDYKQYSKLLAVLSFLWIVIPTITQKIMCAFMLEHLFLLYIMGAYIRKYKEGWLADRRVGILLTIGSIVFLLISVLYLDSPYDIFGRDARDMFGTKDIPVVLLSVGLLLLAVNRQEKNNKFINLCASFTFGIYLIHEHPLLREFIWRTVCPVMDYISEGVFPVVYLGKALGVYVVCMMLEALRQGGMRKVLRG